MRHNLGRTEHSASSEPNRASQQGHLQANRITTSQLVTMHSSRLSSVILTLITGCCKFVGLRTALGWELPWEVLQPVILKPNVRIEALQATALHALKTFQETLYTKQHVACLYSVGLKTPLHCTGAEAAAAEAIAAKGIPAKATAAECCASSSFTSMPRPTPLP
jgi:hypothetical protein